MKEHTLFDAKNAKSLDHSLRKLIQNPEKILKKLIKKEDIVLDFGSGSGFFSIPAAKISKKLIAADIQEDMLDYIKAKIKNNPIKNKITLVKCSKDSINIREKVDFVIMSFIFHEIKNKSEIIKQIRDVMKDNAKLYFSEPWFEVSSKEFNEELQIIKSKGFKLVHKKMKIFRREALLEKINI